MIIESLKALKLKTKIQLTLLMLFAATTVLGVLASHYLEKTVADSVSMLQNNAQNMRYTQEMSLALSEMISTLALDNSNAQFRKIRLRRASDRFERFLQLQSNNITEEGEEEWTKVIKADFENLKVFLNALKPAQLIPTQVYMKVKDLQDLLSDVYEMNEDTIDKKTDEAINTADRVTLYMIIVGFLFFLFALFAMIYFPQYLAEPINILTESIHEIAKKNYSQRLHINSEDEFGEMARSFNLMAEKLEEYENINVSQILSEKRRIETIISRMNEAIIGMDEDRTILFANPPALELIGMQEENLVGKNVQIASEQNEMLETLFEDISNTNVIENKSYSFVAVEKAGKKMYFHKDILKVESQDFERESPTTAGYVMILKNITELKEQDLAKTNFMATLSHELKTPISAIDLSLGLLKDVRIGDLNEEQRELADTINHNTARLLKMVNEILDISTIETGNVKLTYELAPPEAVVVRALDNVKAFVAEKTIKIHSNIQQNLPPLKMDIPKTTGVLINFLSNALRYSAINDKIEIEVARQNGTIEFSVKDEGPGITQEDCKRIFQRYQRSKGDKTKGTGLGLAISKEFIEAQGGRIWVESTVGEGSRFSFALPIG